MANSWTHRIDAEEQGIGVAVNADVAKFEEVSAGFALFPEPITRTREEDNFAGAQRFRERGAVHEAEHQDFSVGSVLDDRGNKSICFGEVELHLVLCFFFVNLNLHRRKLMRKNKKPAGLLRQRVMRILCVRICYAHLIKRGAVP